MVIFWWAGVRTSYDELRALGHGGAICLEGLMSSMDGLATPGRDPDRLQSPVVAGDVPMTDSDIPRVPGEAPAPLPEGSHQHVVPEPFGEADLPPGAPEDLLGRRIAAALIDLVLLTGLGLVLGLTVGEYSFAPGGFSVSLSGAWFLAYVVLALLYYFAVEATTSQTVGKRLVGLRVLRADGSRPSVGAIAGRTLLRIVDWLPLLYLIGFIVMLTTRSRRLRMGDLAANTAVRRAVPGQRRGLAGVSLVVVLAAAVGLTAYRAGSVAGTKIYQGHGIQFEYPGGWDEIGLGTLASGGDAEHPIRTEAVRTTRGFAAGGPGAGHDRWETRLPVPRNTDGGWGADQADRHVLLRRDHGIPSRMPVHHGQGRRGRPSL